MVARKPILALLTGLAAFAPAFAGVGTDAVPFMKVDTGARAAAMAGAFSAVADDPSAVFHNPAGLMLLERKEFMLSHTEWVEGIRNECVSYGHITGGDWAFGAGANMLFSGAMTKYDRNGADTGSFTENEGFVSASAAHALEDNFSAGLTVKGIYQKVDDKSVMAYAADAGLLYHDDTLRLAVGGDNIGPKIKLYKERFDLPAGYKAAAAWRAYDDLWLTGQLWQRPASGLSGAAGAEYGINVRGHDMLYARAGYLAGPGADAGSGLTFGLGVGNGAFKLDYAFTPFGDLGSVHRFSFALKFGEERETLKERKAAESPYNRRYKRKGETWREQKKDLEKEQRQKKTPQKPRTGSYFTW